METGAICRGVHTEMSETTNIINQTSQVSVDDKRRHFWEMAFISRYATYNQAQSAAMADEAVKEWQTRWAIPGPEPDLKEIALKSLRGAL